MSWYIAFGGFFCIKGAIWLDWLQWPTPPSPGGSCTHCIRTDSQPAGWGVLLLGEAGRVPGLEGAQPCSACPKQPVHEPEPSAVHFTYILTWCSASSTPPSFFHPFKETNPSLSSCGPPELGVQLAGHMVTGFCLKKQGRLYLPESYFKAVPFITSTPPSSILYLLQWPDLLPHFSGVCWSNFH